MYSNYQYNVAINDAQRYYSEPGSDYSEANDIHSRIFLSRKTFQRDISTVRGNL